MSDAPTLRELQNQRLAHSTASPTKDAALTRRDSEEVAWLLGVPFVVHAVQGRDRELAGIVCGTCESRVEADRLLDDRWRRSVPEAADTVVCALSDTSPVDAESVTHALTSAARVVKDKGRIVVLAQRVRLDEPGFALMRECHDPRHALKELVRQKPEGVWAAYQWATVVRRQSVYLLSDLTGDAVEELFATPLDSVQQVERLSNQGSCLFLSDAHRCRPDLDT